MKKVIALAIFVITIASCSTESSKASQVVKKSSETTDLFLAVDSTKKVGYVTSEGQVVLNSINLPSSGVIGGVQYDLSDLDHIGTYADGNLYITYLAVSPGTNSSYRFASSVYIPEGAGCPPGSHSCKGDGCSHCSFDTDQFGCITGCQCGDSVLGGGDEGGHCDHSISNGTGASGTDIHDMIDILINAVN